MKTLVLGGNGMLGHKLVQALVAAGHEVATLSRSQPGSEAQSYAARGAQVFTGVDAADFPALEAFLRQRRQEVLINCIGVVKQREAAKDPIPSITLNALLPHKLAEWASDWGGRLIHFSTDCVFSGVRGNYSLDDIPDATDLYGRTKYLGEVSAENALTLRTSIIGRELAHFQSLVEWFLAQEGKTVHGYTRAMYSGMTTLTMASLVLEILESGSAPFGQVAQAVSEPISKHDLLVLIRDAYGLDIKIEPDDSFVCDRTMRPEGLSWRAPSWPEQIQAMAADPTPYRTLSEAKR